MARTPSYPDDAPVGHPVGDPTPAASEEAKAEPKGEDKSGGSNRTRHIVTGAAIGVGSAALVAALLYASRSRKGGGDKAE